MKSIILKIDGMSCSACSNGLEKYLNKQNGINAVVNLVMATASINYDDNITIEEIEKYIEEAGFKSLGEESIDKDDDKSNKIPFIIYGILGFILMYVSMSHMLHLPIISFLDLKKYPIVYSIFLLLITIPFLVYGFDIIKSGFSNLIHKMPNMDTLVSIGIISSFIYSLFNVIMIITGDTDCIHNLYFESCAFIIYFIKLGRFIDKNSKSKTIEAIKELVSITPMVARIKTENGYDNITIDEVKKGDILVCLPGDRAAVDGEIVLGESHFDESFITGESIPVLKSMGSKIIAGSINFESSVEYKAERIGKDSTISEIVRLVIDATNTKMNISNIVDKICSYFIPIVIGIAIFAFIINIIITHDFSISITSFITVLVVACPCSLGLATPLALVVSVGNSARKGLLIKNSEVLEIVNKVDTVIFDKTGTLTHGILSISKINKHCDLSENELLEILASIESNSTHPLALGINNYVKDNNVKKTLDLITEDISGYGVKGRDDKNTYYACNSQLLKKLDIINSYKSEENELSKDGNSVIYLVKNKKVIALIGLKDIVRKESVDVVKKLKELNKNVVMLSGDNKITASKIGNELGIDNIESEYTPKKKSEYISNLISDGRIVMMVGDGINDAPSLSLANVGVSLKGATDIATNSSDVIISSNNLMRIIDLFEVSKATIRNIKQNIFWAFIYNIIMIPIACGLFSFKINPMIACIMMILSSLTVTINALRLGKK